MFSQRASTRFSDPDLHPSPHLARHRAALDELVEIGMDMARMLHRTAQALSPAPIVVAVEDGAVPSDAASDRALDESRLTELAAAFDQIARAVRRTISLARVLETAANPAETGPRCDDAQRVAARARIIRDVEDRIEDVTDGERTESLRAELYERMDGPEFDDLLRDRPVDEVIADIRRDLGVGGPPGYRPPWRRRTPELVAALFARARGDMAGAAAAGAAAAGAAAGPVDGAPSLSAAMDGTRSPVPRTPVRRCGHEPP